MPYTKQESLNYITENLALIQCLVYLRDKISLYDINVLMEDFCVGLLNRVFGWNLRNINLEKRNTPAIDLGDPVTRISVQVTSDKTGNKVKEAVEKFVKYRLFDSYDRLIIMILVPKQESYNLTIETGDHFVFSQPHDIWDFGDLLNKIRGLETDEIQEIREFIEHEFPNQHKRDYDLLKQSNEIINQLNSGDYYSIDMYGRVLYDNTVTDLYAELLKLLMEREIGREYLDGYERFLRGALQPYEMEEYETLSAWSEMYESYERLYEFCSHYKPIIKLSAYKDCEEIVDFAARHRRLLELNELIKLKKKELIEAIIQFLKKHA